MYILSLDLGTTSIKVALVSEEGNVVGRAVQEYSLFTPSPLEVELPVEVYWQSFKVALQDLFSRVSIPRSEIIALGMSVQGETLVMIDEEGNPLGNAIVWLDNRAQKEAELLAKEFTHQYAYSITGQVKIVPTWPATKILWVRHHQPDRFHKTYKFLLLEDYFIYRLTGRFVAEGSLLSSTLYWNIHTRQWWKEMLDYLGVKEDRLPEILEPGEVVGTILLEAAEELGLSQDLKITTGALDQACGAVGVGNVKPGIFSENTGAALAICATVDRAFADPQMRMPCHYHAIPGLYMAHTFTSGGMVLKWYRDRFCSSEVETAELMKRDSYDLLAEEAKTVPPGSGGLVMLPHLEGAMAPEANPKAKGVFFGFTLHHQRSHFVRSVMEGIACIIRRNMEVLRDLGMEFEEVISLGGGAKSALWNQIKADLLNKRVVTTFNDQDAACLGAAIIAGKAVGLYSNIEDACKKVVKKKQVYNPDPINREVYDLLYTKYIKLYDSLVRMFEIG